jgi:hypothetical protein
MTLTRLSAMHEVGTGTAAGKPGALFQPAAPFESKRNAGFLAAMAEIQLTRAWKQ